MLLANLFGATCFLFGGLDDGSTFGLSLVWCVFFIPLSFLCWFRPAYKAFRSDSSFNFMVFFLIFFAQFCYSVLMALGIKQIGGWYGYSLISHIISYHIYPISYFQWIDSGHLHVHWRQSDWLRTHGRGLLHRIRHHPDHRRLDRLLPGRLLHADQGKSLKTI